MSMSRTGRATVKVMGLDASLVSSGVSVRGANGEVVTSLISTKKLRGIDRLQYNYEKLEEVMEEYSPDVMVIEGYAMGKGSNNLASMGEWGGVAKLLARQRRMEVITVTPSSLKMLITGDGGAKGKHIMKECLHRMSSSYSHITQDDEVDACCLMLVGEALVNKTGSPRLIQSLRNKMKEQKPGIERMA